MIPRGVPVGFDRIATTAARCQLCGVELRCWLPRQLLPLIHRHLAESHP